MLLTQVEVMVWDFWHLDGVLVEVNAVSVIELSEVDVVVGFVLDDEALVQGV